MHPVKSFVSLGLVQGQKSLPVIEEKASARRMKRHSKAETEKSIAQRKKQRSSIEDAAAKIMNRKRTSGEVSDIDSSPTSKSNHDNENLSREVQARLNPFQKVSYPESQLELDSPLGSPMDIPRPGTPVDEISKLLQSGKIPDVLELLQSKFSLTAHRKSNLDIMLQEKTK